MAGRDRNPKKTDRSEAQRANRVRPARPRDDLGRDEAVVHREEHVFGNEPHRQVGRSQTKRDEGRTGTGPAGYGRMSANRKRGPVPMGPLRREVCAGVSGIGG